MIRKNMASFAVVSVIYALSDIDKERAVEIYKFILSMNLKKIDFLYLTASILALFVATIGLKELLKSMLKRIEIRREIMLNEFKKRLEKKQKEKKQWLQMCYYYCW